MSALRACVGQIQLLVLPSKNNVCIRSPGNRLSSLNLIHRCIKQSMAEKCSDQLKLPVKHDASLLSWARWRLSLILFLVTVALNRVTASLKSLWASTMSWWYSSSRSSALSWASLQTARQTLTGFRNLPSREAMDRAKSQMWYTLIHLRLLNDGYFQMY